MAITRQLVGVYSTGETVAALPAGSDRLLLVSIIVGGGQTITSLTVGGVSATEIVQQTATIDNSSLFYIKEANLPTGGGLLTVNGGVTFDKAEVVVLDNVDQTSPIAASGVGINDTTQTGVVGKSGDMAYTVAMHSNSIFLTIGGGYTLGSSLQGSASNRGNTAYKAVTDTSDNTIAWLDDGAASGDACVAWAVISEVSAANTTINVDIPSDIDLEWGATHELAVTHDGGTTTLSGVTLSAPTGWETVSFSTIPDTGTTESFYEYSQSDVTVGNFTAQVGDTLAFTSATGLTIDGSSIPVVNPAATVTGSYKWWDASLSTWTPVSSYTITNLGVFGGGDTTVMIQEMISDMISEMVN